jgi:hypothetical protein
VPDGLKPEQSWKLSDCTAAQTLGLRALMSAEAASSREIEHSGIGKVLSATLTRDRIAATPRIITTIMTGAR